MIEIRILFLGAGNRLSLIEHFYSAATARSLNIKIFSAETSDKLPIAHAAKIVLAPKFKTLDFDSWLIDFVKNEEINIVIPNMDSATVSLSELRGVLEGLNVFAVVSTLELCKTMEDKELSDLWFKSNGLPTPGSEKYPLIIKHRHGFGGREQYIVKNEIEKNKLFLEIHKSDYLVQEYIVGKEYTVDAYVDLAGNVIGIVPRERLKVVDGEVNDSLTVRHENIERMSKNLLSSNSGWRGPITLQFIEGPLTGCKIIEINPRFGGGATHSIHCGLDMPGWILDEYIGRKLSPIVNWKVNSLMTRCRRDVFHEHTA